MDLLKDYMMKSSSFKENSPFPIFYLFYVKDGYLEGTPFSVLFGKKDIWLPRSGHIVSLKVNGEVVPVSMTLNSEGQAYFSTLEVIGIFDIFCTSKILKTGFSVQNTLLNLCGQVENYK